MQQQQYNNPYSVWQQPIYPQQHTQPIYPQSLPVPTNGAGYTPYPNQYAQLGPQPGGYQQEQATPYVRSKKPKHRHAISAPVVPRKSTFRKNGPLAIFPTTENAFSRPRTGSFSRQEISRQETSLHRIRTQSNPRQNGSGKIIGDHSHAHHLFISFHGYNEMHLANISTLALQEMEETIWPLWPGGATSHVVNYTAIVKFYNDPWDMSGPNTRIAYDILVKLFRLCASRGYSYQTNYNLISVPELVFQPGNCDEGATFFLGYLSKGGRKLTLIKAPDPINVALNPRLRDILPPNVILDLGESGDLQSVEMKKPGGLFGGSQTLSPKLFFMQVLRILGEFGYYLDVALPLYRRGPLGIRLRREILVFKGHVPA